MRGGTGSTRLQNMKAVPLIFLVIYISTLVVSHEWSTREPCIQYNCLRSIDDVPVCGKIKKNNCWVEVIFPNECYLLSANNCGRSMTAVWSHKPSPKPCIMYKCSTFWDPVCGKQMVNGCMEERIFTNACHMASANGCGKANYVPCVENICQKPA